ncbi:2,3-diaminopropionate biosynthesis protein SbnA [Jidongwangia harbinensis]|uniref:2,3-diaminopropionate biosynthesis protein SbnA n=1 Tax=Jidongwangia harbinensis TaxID=2878561 RepID=UPI001CD9F1EB|nr:2,3-diaminopropionate biosynthesis protein SbnA [Jidongwangia harbinensis]MCA2218373.1 2,3-diaminopropionate biosynthesis protein SbnA [Jidongwangia harbinensis]
MITDPQEFHVDDVFVDLRFLGPHPLFLKCEAFNFAGSVKLRPAEEMVAAAERSGRLRPGSVLIESSSGNLGVALAMIAASRGYRFVCVADPRCNPVTRRIMEALGADVHVVTEPDPVGGFVGARIAYVRGLCAGDDRYVWLDQYTNEANWLAHYHQTAPAIAKSFPAVDVVFVGAGTTGTLMGCARYFRENRPEVRIVAVDAHGSVTFGGPAGPRLIPGLGMGVRPPLLDESLIDDVRVVSEAETIRTCRRLAGHGFLFGGSTGTVVSGALQWLAERDRRSELVAVAIAPDLGERYLDSVYGLPGGERRGQVGQHGMLDDLGRRQLAVEAHREPDRGE